MEMVETWELVFSLVAGWWEVDEVALVEGGMEMAVYELLKALVRVMVAVVCVEADWPWAWAWEAMGEVHASPIDSTILL